MNDGRRVHPPAMEVEKEHGADSGAGRKAGVGSAGDLTESQRAILAAFREIDLPAIMADREIDPGYTWRCGKCLVTHDAVDEFSEGGEVAVCPECMMTFQASKSSEIYRDDRNGNDFIFMRVRRRDIPQ